MLVYGWGASGKAFLADRDDEVFLTLRASLLPHHVLSIHAARDGSRRGHDTRHGREKRPLSVSSGLIVERVRERRDEERNFLAEVLSNRGFNVPTLAGHRDIKMTLRYVHLAPSHLRAGIQALEQRNVRHPAGLVLSTEPRVTPVSRDFSQIAQVLVVPTGFEPVFKP